MGKLFASRWFHLIAVIAIAASVSAAYSNTLHAVFQFDDLPNIVENQSLKNPGNFWHILKGGRGVTMATFAINYAIGGLNVTGYHIVNIAIHIINGILAYFFLFNTFKLIDSGEVWAKRIAVFSALIFALHPIQTQAVTYIVQRLESLSSLFYLASLLFFIKAAASTSALKKWLLYACVCASYAVGFYAKELAFTIPATILLYDFYFTSDFSVRNVFSKWPLYAVLGALLVFFTVNTIMPVGGFGDLSKESSTIEVKTESVTGADAGDTVSVKVSPKGPTVGFGVSNFTPREYLLTQMNVLVYYMSLLIAPVRQNLDYDFPVSRGLFETPVVREGTVLNMPVTMPAVSLAVLLAIIAAAFYLAFRSFKKGSPSGRLISFFIFWFFIIIAPTSSIVPIADVIFEHRVYLPSLGFFAVFVILVDMFSGLLFGGKKALKKAE